MTHAWIEPVAEAQIAHRERGRKEIGNRKLTSLALAAAMALVAGACEGADSGRSSNEATASDSFVLLQAQLDDQAARDLFDVVAEQWTYWRLYALDLFDGSTWAGSDPNGTNRRLEYTSPAEVRGDPAPEDAPSSSYLFRALNHITASWLPMPDRPETITVTDFKHAVERWLRSMVLPERWRSPVGVASETLA